MSTRSRPSFKMIKGSTISEIDGHGLCVIKYSVRCICALTFLFFSLIRSWGLCLCTNVKMFASVRVTAAVWYHSSSDSSLSHWSQLCSCIWRQLQIWTGSQTWQKGSKLKPASESFERKLDLDLHTHCENLILNLNLEWIVGWIYCTCALKHWTWSSGLPLIWS